ncbi:MAG: hypothetical protein J3K34DRAFT_435999 [Monoraphidium minutum]|nr:MAG: hypothetical protein J3K34DRAFT_435999 [Monoraphidium minutum]
MGAGRVPTHVESASQKKQMVFIPRNILLRIPPVCSRYKDAKKIPVGIIYRGHTVVLYHWYNTGEAGIHIPINSQPARCSSASPLLAALSCVYMINRCKTDPVCLCAAKTRAAVAVHAGSARGRRMRTNGYGQSHATSFRDRSFEGRGAHIQRRHPKIGSSEERG